MTEITIEVEAPFAEQVDPAALEAVVAKTLANEGIENAAVSLLITDDATVRALNAQYRGQDETTDVLSFALEEGPAFALPPGMPRQLGEVIISFEQAERQARALGNPLPRELALLAVHGTLHLLGYDHETPPDRARMVERERAILGAGALIERSG